MPSVIRQQYAPGAVFASQEGSGSVVQMHVLAGQNASQANTSTAGGINNVVIPSQFVAHVPAGVFSARAPSGEYSATVPGNYRASI